MKDPRGVERGKCTKCPCTQYELEKGATRAACAYCECPAPAHEAITADTGKRELMTSTPLPPVSVSFSSSSSLSDLASPSSSNNVVCLEIPSDNNLVRDLLNDCSVIALEPTSDDIEECFPKLLPKKVQTALQMKTTDANHKSCIVRHVVDNLYNKGYNTNSSLKKAARRMARKWSPLKNKLDPDHKALYEKLRNRRDRINSCPNKNPRENNFEGEASSISPEEAKHRMQLDWASGLRQVTDFRANLAATRGKRKQEAKKIPALQLFRQYPALALKELVLEEFEAEMGVSCSSMVLRWKGALPTLVKYFSESQLKCTQSDTAAERTLSILEGIHLVPLWANKKQASNRAARVLEMFDENTPIDEMRPGTKDPPRLLATGSIAEGTLSIQCYIDTEAFFSSEDPVESLLLLLSAYFLMNIKWGASRLPLVLLCCATVGSHKVSSDVARNNKFNDLLKYLHLL